MIAVKEFLDADGSTFYDVVFDGEESTETGDMELVEEYEIF